MKPRVLIIDDSEIAAVVARAYLNAGGFESRIAGTLYEFGAALEGWAPDVVLADVNMPGLSGTEICRWVKEQHHYIPVLLYSSMNAERLEVVAKAAGADAWLSKDEGLERLVEEVRKLLPSDSTPKPV